MTISKVGESPLCPVYYVNLDKSSSIGILRFSKEVSVWVDGECNFLYADALTPGGWFDYEIEQEFELDWPGVMVEVKKSVKDFIEKEVEV